MNDIAHERNPLKRIEDVIYRGIALVKKYDAVYHQMARPDLRRSPKGVLKQGGIDHLVPSLSMLMSILMVEK